MYTGRITWETLRSIDSATFTGSYQSVGSPFVHDSYICKLVNNSNVLVTISIDGIVDVDVAPANSFWLYDEGKVGLSGGFPMLPSGTRIFVKGSAGTGSVYVVSQYIVST